jgi:hypothetical protein
MAEDAANFASLSKMPSFSAPRLMTERRHDARAMSGVGTDRRCSLSEGISAVEGRPAVL